MNSERSILLCGPMGSGKSTVGRALAQLLGWRFVDLDAEIEARAGMTVAEIFEREGEPGFRARERAALRELPGSECVVALGGGAVEAAENREILASRGRLVWLDARPETQLSRIGAGATRPMLFGLDQAGKIARLRELSERRAVAYATAELRLDTDGRSVAELCREIGERLGPKAAPERGR
jgi:shikimate kinase